MCEPQTVLITGGASGIGFAIAEAVLAQGWRAVVADLDRSNLDSVREKLGARDDLRLEHLNVADEDAVIRTMESCENDFGPLTGVVNSAGIGKDLPALDSSSAFFRKILDVNLVGSFIVSREAAKQMGTRGGGAILNIASVSGIQGNAGRTAYGASKAGVITMTRVMAVELAASGIRVNAIAPGPIDTPLVEEMHTPEARLAWISRVPQRRYGTPGEIAYAATFLLDPRKSSFITGQTLCIDGGFSIAGMMQDDRVSVPAAA